MAGPVPYPRAVLSEVVARCEAAPGAERCGLVLRRPGGGLEVVELPNAAPAEEARERFELEPAALLRVLGELDACGGAVAAIWHSHVEAPAVLSARDVDGALVGGRPVLPGAEQLVVGLRGGRAAEVRRFVLDGGAFVEAPLPR